jgi:protein SCO1/2
MVVGVVIALLGTLTLGAIIAPTLALRERPAPLDVYGLVPAFDFRDHLGAAISNRDLLGKVVVMNFIFTRCPTMCPAFSMKMRRVQDRTGDVTEDLKLISFTVDPAYDTPEVLAEYAEKQGADPTRWRFVTGDHESLHTLVSEGFALALEQAGADPNGTPDIVHAEHFVLVDRRGAIRGYYDSNDAQRIERMLQDARRLMREPWQD